MLRKLYFSAEKLSAGVPSSCSIPSSKVDAYRFSDGSFDIWKARSTTGMPRRFCAWSEQLGTVGGESLQYPRRRLDDAAELQIAPAGTVRVWKRQGRIVARLDNSREVHLRSVGLRNHVVLERVDGTLLADFSAFGGVIVLDPGVLANQERVLLLYVLGAGLVQRARRFGIIPRTLLQGPFD